MPRPLRTVNQSSPATIGPSEYSFGLLRSRPLDIHSERRATRILRMMRRRLRDFGRPRAQARPQSVRIEPSACPATATAAQAALGQFQGRVAEFKKRIVQGRFKAPFSAFRRSVGGASDTAQLQRTPRQKQRNCQMLTVEIDCAVESGGKSFHNLRH